MVNINTVILGGNLTRDPEVRYTPQGTAVASLGLAVNRSFRSKEGEKKQEVCFIDVEAWGRQAETCGEFLKKGSPVLVEGRLVQDNWEGKDGQKRTRHKVSAFRVQFLPKGPGVSVPPEEDAAPAPAPFEEEFPGEEPPPAEKKEAGDEPPF